MRRPKVRIYFPDFPYPPLGGSPYVVYDQLSTFSSLGFEVELVCWNTSDKAVHLKKEQAFPGGFPKEIKLTLLGSHQTESRSARIGRVVRSLVSPLSSPEWFYYPPNRFPVLHEPVDLAIYH